MHEYVVLAAQVTTALLVGSLYGFAVGVMPGLARVGDATFVTVMNNINVAIVNPAFLLVFLGSPLLSVAVLGYEQTATTYAAAALAVVTLLISILGNIPLNNQLAARARRAEFERRWRRLNAARTVTGLAGLLCLHL